MCCQYKTENNRETEGLTGGNGDRESVRERGTKLTVPEEQSADEIDSQDTKLLDWESAGQFIYEEVTLTQLPGSISEATGNDPQKGRLSQGNPEPEHMALKVKERTVDVVKKSRRIYSGTHTVHCWFAKNNAAKLIDGQYKDYVVSHMFDTEEWPHGTNTH